jgi:hypothetical protein
MNMTTFGAPKLLLGDLFLSFYTIHKISPPNFMGENRSVQMYNLVLLSQFFNI